MSSKKKLGKTRYDCGRVLFPFLFWFPISDEHFREIRLKSPLCFGLPHDSQFEYNQLVEWISTNNFLFSPELFIKKKNKTDDGSNVRVSLTPLTEATEKKVPGDWRFSFVFFWCCFCCCCCCCGFCFFAGNRFGFLGNRGTLKGETEGESEGFF